VQPGGLYGGTAATPHPVGVGGQRLVHERVELAGLGDLLTQLPDTPGLDPRGGAAGRGGGSTDWA
jgi:hypothetical protein